MVASLPECVKQGEQARLIPIVAETGKEKRVASVFLSGICILTHISAEMEHEASK